MLAKTVPTVDDYLKNNAHLLRYKESSRLTGRRQDDLQCPLITVITIVRNGKEALPQAIMSVLNQSYSNIEYIVIDGASTDGTLEVVKRFDDKIDFWISEPDSGTSDAFNKAVSVAGGDFIFWLASDDWIDPFFLEAAAKTLMKTGVDFVFGDMVMYKPGNPGIVYKGEKNYTKSLMSGWPRFNTPTMLTKKKSFQKVGLMDMTYNFVADYEWVLRLHLNGEKGFYDSSLVVHRRMGGIGSRHLMPSAFEHLRLLRQYQLPKTKAMAFYLYRSIRMGAGHLVRLFLPGIIYEKLRRKQWKNKKSP